MSAVHSITRLGHRGDGIADTPDGPLYVAGALPGEEVRVERESKDRARRVEVLAPSPERAVPPCPHFGACGGCAAQHMSAALYRDWKRGVLRAALDAQGLTPEIADMVAVPPASRRRAVFALSATSDRATSNQKHPTTALPSLLPISMGRRWPDGPDEGLWMKDPSPGLRPSSPRERGEELNLTGLNARGRPVLGFHEARSETVLDVPECRILVPAIADAHSGLASLLAPLAPRHGTVDVTVLATASGLDVVVDAPTPSPALRGRLIAGGAAAGLARLTVGPETLATWRPPILDVAGVPLVPPPGGFVQAVADAEEALASEVRSIVAGAKRVVDLFAGAGAFTLRLLKGASVHAVEAEAAALAALVTAARDASGLKPVTTERRDLFRRPLTAAELKPFDAVVLDPPRQGAEAQARAFATSAVRRIAYVSCNPATFARDARLLVDGGYVLERVLPVDQFLWSAHMEIVAAFRREAGRAATVGLRRR